LVGAKDDGGGDNSWSYGTCKAPVKMSPPRNQHPTYLLNDACWYTGPFIPQ